MYLAMRKQIMQKSKFKIIYNTKIQVEEDYHFTLPVEHSRRIKASP